LLDVLNVPLEVAAAQFADAKKALGDTPLSQAVEFYIKRHPTKIEAKTVQEVVAEFLKAKKGDQLSERYLQCLRYCLGKFKSAFNCSIGSVTATEIDDWLRMSGLSPRSRNNLRNSVQTLFRYAKARRYLPKDHDEIEAVPVVKDRDGAIETFTPSELVEILDWAGDRLIPFFTLGAFAGIRHAEIQRLDWKDICFEESIIEVRAAKAKTASRRTVPILNNVRQWLLPLRQATGPVCKYRNMAFEIDQLVQRINAAREAREMHEAFVWKHNAMRHSFISYRVADIQNVAQIALEAGNSPQIISRHYRALVRPKDAAKWFGIVPKSNVLSLAGAA